MTRLSRELRRVVSYIPPLSHSTPLSVADLLLPLLCNLAPTQHPTLAAPFTLHINSSLTISTLCSLTEQASATLKSTVGLNAKEAEGSVKEMTGEAKGMTGEVKGKASEMMGEAKGKTQEMAGQAKGKTQEMTGQAKGKVEEVKGKM